MKKIFMIFSFAVLWLIAAGSKNVFALPITDYTVYLREDGFEGTGYGTINGNVGSSENLDLVPQVNGNVVSGGDINADVINGNATAAGHINATVITGEKNEFAPMSLITPLLADAWMPFHDVIPGTTSYYLEDGQTLVLTPGNYNYLQSEEKTCDIYFSSGDYHFSFVNIYRNNCRIFFDVTDGPINILSYGIIQFDTADFFISNDHGATYSQNPYLAGQIYFQSFDHIVLHDSTAFGICNAELVARITGGTNLYGSVYTQTLHMQDDSVISQVPAQTNPVPEPATIFLMSSGLIGLLFAKNKH